MVESIFATHEFSNIFHKVTHVILFKIHFSNVIYLVIDVKMTDILPPPKKTYI